MNNNMIEINKLIELMNDLDNLPSSLIQNTNYELERLDIIYKRSTHLSNEINYPNNNKKLNLIGYFAGYPFKADDQWLIAKDKLELFLSDMLDYVRGDGIEQTNCWILIHKNILEVSLRKFENGHYADSVESAFKSVNKCVKEIVKARTGNELDGVSLMREAFNSRNTNPIILLDEVSSESGRNIQEGYMQLFAGAMQGIRNPKAHDNIDITKERAMHQIFLASLLMHKLDEAKL